MINEVHGNLTLISKSNTIHRQQEDKQACNTEAKDHVTFSSSKNKTADQEKAIAKDRALRREAEAEQKLSTQEVQQIIAAIQFIFKVRAVQMMDAHVIKPDNKNIIVLMQEQRRDL